MGDSEAGEVDIYVDTFSRHPDAYFVFECKRLNVVFASGRDSQASEYVGETGMGCFISGQYPTTCGCGGMLGYVMDGNVPSAVVAVNTALRSHADKLHLCAPQELGQAQIAPNPMIRQTTHKPNQETVIIYHVFLAF